MFKSHSVALTALAAALALPLAVGSAQAAVVGSFDPGFPFAADANNNPRATNNLGYRGTITLDLSAGCQGSTGYVNNGAGNCTITLDNVTIDYYNAGIRSAPEPGDYLVVQSLSATDVYSDPTTFITGAYFDAAGNLLAFDSNESNNIYVSVTDDNQGYPVSYNPNGQSGYPGTFDNFLNLSFDSGFFPFGERFAGFTTAAVQGPRGMVDPTATMTDTNSRTDDQLDSFRATVTVGDTNFDAAAAVPEPGSAALALIGLGAWAAARRRKSTKQKRRAEANPSSD